MLEALSAIFTGACLVLGGVCLGIKQMLSAEDRPNYPTAGPWSRFVMFWLSAALIVWGLNIIMVGNPVSGYGMMTAPLLMAHFAGRLYTHLSQRASVRTQRLITRLHNMARCAPKDSPMAARLSAATSGIGDPETVPNAVSELRRSGVRVSAPNEGPEAFTGPWQ